MTHFGLGGLVAGQIVRFNCLWNWRGVVALQFADQVDGLKRRDFVLSLGITAVMWPLEMSSQPNPVQGEDPSEAAARFYREYMAPGVSLKPLGERWFTARFQGVIDAFYESKNPAQQVTEGDPILPWKNWDSSWRNKLKAEVLKASPDRAQVLVVLATDNSGQPIARLVHLARAGNTWRIDDVTDAPR